MVYIKEKNTVKLITAGTFLLMIFVNFLANALPINGVTSGQVSDNYLNLFAPAGITFAIWGLIYLLLAGFTVYQFGFFTKFYETAKKELIKNVSIYFSISSVANTIWIFAWHFDAIGLSLIMITTILICLISIHNKLNQYELSATDYILMRLPFSVYFGWITIAVIANVTTFLVSINWNGFGIPENLWTIIILLVGLGIASMTMLNSKDAAYGAVIIWAYLGILIKHISKTGFAGQYPLIIITVILCLALLIIGELYLIKNKYILIYGGGGGIRTHGTR